MTLVGLVLASFDDVEKLARLANETPEEFAAGVEAARREYAEREAARQARAEAIRHARLDALTIAPAPTRTRWTCPCCATAIDTTEAAPRCFKCGYRDD